MGMTFWVHTLEERNYLADSADHSMMLDHADALDVLCDRAGVRKLSEFIDFTDQLYLDEEDDAIELEAGPVLDPETGLVYGIDDMAWFDAAEGLASLRAVRERLALGLVAEVGAEALPHLLRELDDCIAIVEGPAARGGKFHLALVE